MQATSIGGLGAAGVGVIAFLTVIGGSWYTVGQTERGVVTRNGAVVSQAEPGLGFKIPWVDDVKKIDVTTKTVHFKKLDTYSYDSQQTFIDVSVMFHAAPEKVRDLYAKFGSLDNFTTSVIQSIVNQQTKIVFGQYTASRAIQTREKLNQDIAIAIENAIKEWQMVGVEAVRVENIEFSPAYVKSVEQRMLAEVEVQRQQQQLAQEKIKADITVTQAKASADSQLAQRAAEAQGIKLIGDAQAAAITARAKALGDNPFLVQLTQAERWDGKLPATMVPGGALPMIGVGNK